MNISRFLLVLCFLAATTAHAASFDCEKTLTPMEETICEDREISDLDEVLLRTYEAVLRISEDPASVKIDQRRWLTKIRNGCDDEKCLVLSYANRISELEDSWKKKTVALHSKQRRNALSNAKPFEGNWNSCQLIRGDEVCVSYTLLQNGERICGESEHWATFRTYDGRLQATLQARGRATVEASCGSVGGTGCVDPEDGKDRWETVESTLLVCGNQLYNAAADKQCSELSRAPGFFYSNLTNAQRKEMLSQPWLKQCIGKN
ncbi:hypothetical protein RJO15_20400 [Herbaspirillum huttiense F1]|uniref:lysozyme inhibitor LprI family protein n=1 Tax=Herbaspirillum TaxID=963 RepID=UPI001AE5C9D6|nr:MULTISPECIES: hypothetical protein [Herbaspirillum]MBP1313378.1 uncharacterized protein [Herbaspirillum sp. 1130]MDT0358161.1 hypothetical protein [Herbaspirillum huttiense F1]